MNCYTLPFTFNKRIGILFLLYFGDFSGRRTFRKWGEKERYHKGADSRRNGISGSGGYENCCDPPRYTWCCHWLYLSKRKSIRELQWWGAIHFHFYERNIGVLRQSEMQQGMLQKNYLIYSNTGYLNAFC